MENQIVKFWDHLDDLSFQFAQEDGNALLETSKWQQKLNKYQQNLKKQLKTKVAKISLYSFDLLHDLNGIGMIVVTSFIDHDDYLIISAQNVNPAILNAKLIKKLDHKLSKYKAKIKVKTAQRWYWVCDLETKTINVYDPVRKIFVDLKQLKTYQDQQQEWLITTS